MGLGLGVASVANPVLGGVAILATLLWGRLHGARWGLVLGLAACLGWLISPRALPQVSFTSGPFVGNVTVLRVPRATTTGVSAPVRMPDGAVRVAFWEGRQPWAKGDVLAVRGTLSPPSEGQDQEYRRRGWEGRLRVVGPGERLGGGSGVSALGQSIRNAFGARVSERLPGDEGALVRALCFNEDAELSPALREALARTGTVHVISTSGMHVMLVAALMLGLLAWVPLPRWTQVGLVLAFLLVFTAAAGDRPPALRAVALFGLASLAYLARRPLDLPNALAVVFVGFVVLDPPSLFEPGFQLSFAAMGALVTAPWPAGTEPVHSGSIRGARRGWRWVMSLLGASLRVTVVTLPLTALWFGQVAWIGPLANLVIAPWSGLIVKVGLIGWGLSWSPGWMEVLAPLLGFMARVLEACVYFFAELPGAFSRLPPPPSWAVAVFLGAYFGVALRDGPDRVVAPHRTRLGQAQIATLIVLVGLGLGLAGELVGWWDPAKGPAARPEVVMLQVGQGDATVVRSQGQTMLVDAGPRVRNWDAGERLVAPALYRMGVRSLDVVSLSHADLDHIGGLPALSRRFRVGRVVVSLAFREDPELRQMLREAGLADRVTWVTDVTAWRVGEVQVRAWAPPVGGTTGLAEGNATSLMLRMSARGRAMVLPGDATQETEAVALASGLDWRADGVLMGHHGSRTSTSGPWLDAVGPRWAVASVGRGNRYGHPSLTTWVRVARRGIRGLRTDRDGSLRWEFDERLPVPAFDD